jgi:hypothetical protein
MAARMRRVTLGSLGGALLLTVGSALAGVGAGLLT